MSAVGPGRELVLRPALAADLPAVAEVHVRAREQAVPAMPPLVHPAAEVRRHIASWDLDELEVWLAEDSGDHGGGGGRLLGYATLHGSWLDALYVEPDAQRGGVGSALLEVVTALRPAGFGLWVFESNRAARAFYAARGLIELERTDGSGNEERSPDLRLAWPGADPPPP